MFRILLQIILDGIAFQQTAFYWPIYYKHEQVIMTEMFRLDQSKVLTDIRNIQCWQKKKGIETNRIELCFILQTFYHDFTSTAYVTYVSSKNHY